MKNILLLVLVVLSIDCVADEKQFWNDSVDWVKSTLPEKTRLDFTKSRFKFNGCKHKEYALNLSQPIMDNFYIESGVSYAKGKLNWGIHQQEISLVRVSLVPRVDINEAISVGFGIVLQSAPEFRTNQGDEVDLPKSKSFLLNSRFNLASNKHYVEVQLSSDQWQQTATQGSWMERGQTDSKISLNYKAAF